jgi:hypothetical protein
VDSLDSGLGMRLKIGWFCFKSRLEMCEVALIYCAFYAPFPAIPALTLHAVWRRLRGWFDLLRLAFE